MRLRVNLHLDGAPSLSLERHQSGTTWIALHDSAYVQETDAQYVAVFAPLTPAQALYRAVVAFNREINAAIQGEARHTPPQAAE